MTLPTALRRPLEALVDEALVRQLEGLDLNADQLSALHQLAAVAQHGGCLSCLDEDVVAAQVAEYEAEAERLQQQLDIIGVREEHLTDPGRAALHTLAATGSALQLAHVTDASLAAAWATLACQHTQAQGMQMRVSQRLASLRRQLQAAERGRAELDTALASATAQLDRMQADIDAPQGLQARLAEFAQRVERYKKDVARQSDVLRNKAGWRPELAHHALVERSAENDRQAAELAALQAKLASYQDLPPSQLGAELRLRQAQDQLVAVKSRLQQGMANLS